jgi:hypothetical protein
MKSQVTKDKDFVSIYDNADSLILAYNFALNDRYKDNCKAVIDAYIRSKRITPALDTYIKQKELELCKTRDKFTEAEKKAYTNEFMDIYNVANSLLIGGMN